MVLLETMFQALKPEHVKGTNAPVLKAYMGGTSSPDGLDLIKRVVPGTALVSESKSVSVVTIHYLLWFRLWF